MNREDHYIGNEQGADKIMVWKGLTGEGLLLGLVRKIEIFQSLDRIRLFDQLGGGGSGRILVLECAAEDIVEVVGEVVPAFSRDFTHRASLSRCPDASLP